VDGVMGLVVKRPMTEDEYVAFMSERGWRYDVKAETERYLADDRDSSSSCPRLAAYGHSF
jgi:hypothetical protein